MAVRPLHYPTCNATDPLGVYDPLGIYGRPKEGNLIAQGRSVYFTDDGYWSIVKWENGWFIESEDPEDFNGQQLHAACVSAGIYEGFFPTRRAAVEALEAVVETGV